MNEQIEITPEQRKAVSDLICKCLNSFVQIIEENENSLTHIPSEERMPYVINLLCTNLIASIFVDPSVKNICEFYDLCKDTTRNHATKWNT